MSLVNRLSPRILHAASQRSLPVRRCIRDFHVSALYNMVQPGDAIPDVELVEKSPGNKVSLAQELASGKGLIIGVPAAFSEWRSANP